MVQEQTQNPVLKIRTDRTEQDTLTHINTLYIDTIPQYFGSTHHTNKISILFQHDESYYLLSLFKMIATIVALLLNTVLLCLHLLQ